MTSIDKYDYEAELKAAKRAEIERLWFAEEATNTELLEAYKALDVKEEVPCSLALAFLILAFISGNNVIK